MLKNGIVFWVGKTFLQTSLYDANTAVNDPVQRKYNTQYRVGRGIDRRKVYNTIRRGIKYDVLFFIIVNTKTKKKTVGKYESLKRKKTTGLLGASLLPN